MKLYSGPLAEQVSRDVCTTCRSGTSGVLHLVPPYRVVVEVEADAQILVVGVYAVGQSALRVVQRAARLVLTAAASHVSLPPPAHRAASPI